MSEHRHDYRLTITWEGDRGSGTSSYRAYGRDHRISVPGKSDILASADPHFLGDPARWNPEELLLASVSACHKLWYLHFCAVSGVVVTAYEDHAEGTMQMDESGGGRFTEILLRPRVTIKAGTYPQLALELHGDAHEKCFIANSVNFPVRCLAEIVEA